MVGQSAKASRQGKLTRGWVCLITAATAAVTAAAIREKQDPNDPFAAGIVVSIASAVAGAGAKQSIAVTTTAGKQQEDPDPVIAETGIIVVAIVATTVACG